VVAAAIDHHRHTPPRLQHGHSTPAFVYSATKGQLSISLLLFCDAGEGAIGQNLIKKYLYCLYKGDSEYENGLCFVPYTKSLVPFESRVHRSGRVIIDRERGGSAGIKERGAGMRARKREQPGGVANETEAGARCPFGEPRTRSRVVGVSVMYVVGGAKW